MTDQVVPTASQNQIWACGHYTGWLRAVNLVAHPGNCPDHDDEKKAVAPDEMRAFYARITKGGSSFKHSGPRTPSLPSKATSLSRNTAVGASRAPRRPASPSVAASVKKQVPR
jgi:hypothetical protein